MRSRAKGSRSPSLGSLFPHQGLSQNVSGEGWFPAVWPGPLGGKEGESSTAPGQCLALFHCPFQPIIPFCPASHRSIDQSGPGGHPSLRPQRQQPSPGRCRGVLIWGLVLGPALAPVLRTCHLLFPGAPSVLGQIDPELSIPPKELGRKEAPFPLNITCPQVVLGVRGVGKGPRGVWAQILSSEGDRVQGRGSWTVLGE
jgi:hypothetical protein